MSVTSTIAPVTRPDPSRAGGTLAAHLRTIRALRLRDVRATFTRHPRRFWAALGVTAVLVTVVVGIVVTRKPPAPAGPEVRARVYRSIDACLLTDSRGITDGTSLAVWQGMQQYSLDTAVRVSYVPVTGSGDAAGAAPLLAGLVQRHCAVIITTGTAQNASAESAAEAPDIQFLILGDMQQDGDNLHTIDPTNPYVDDETTQALTRLITL